MKKTDLIILVGGGTGGHIFPLIAVAEEFCDQKIPFLYIGSANSLEEETVKKNKWEFIAISSGKFRRYFGLSSLAQNFVDFFKVIIGFFQSLWILSKRKPRAVLSKGGYVALPVVYAAKFLGIRVVIHESDSIMGLTNKLSKPIASKILTMFDPKTYPNATDKFLQVGIPIRKTLRQAAQLKSPKKIRPIILILPGSQGSTAINNLLKPIVVSLLKIADVIHMTGQRDYQEFVKIRESFPVKQKNHYKVYSFIDRELPYYYQLSDLIICRASATTIAEAALFSKALFLIPLPSSASNHQQKNADILLKAQTVKVGIESELDSEKLLAQISEAIFDFNKIKLLGESLHRYSRSKETIALIIEELTK